MAHSHEHDHHGHDHHGAIDYGRAFMWGIILNAVYVAVEFGAGLRLSSMALVSDAGHNLSDIVSLVLAWLAFKLAQHKATDRYTYGYRKSTVLVSLANACLLFAAVGIIIWESISKLSHPQPVDGLTMMWVAGVGIVVNAFTAMLFMRNSKHDLNIRGAFLHMAADALVSAGVVVAGIIIHFTGFNAIDPIMGLVVAAVILVSTARLLFDSLRLSLDGVPEGIELNKVRDAVVERVKGVEDMHHIHIWAISTTQNAVTAHIVAAEDADPCRLRCEIRDVLSEFGITHSTLEMERSGDLCDGECCCSDDDNDRH